MTVPSKDYCLKKYEVMKIADRKYLSGTSLAGKSPTRSRAENDFYATPFETTQAILERVPLIGSILEPAAGQGHISKMLRDFYPNNEVVSTDLIKREDKFGCAVQGGRFLNSRFWTQV